MVTFLDGPVRGHTLMLRRAPDLLRVVQQGGEFDALDQIEDEPAKNERIYVYRRVGEPSFLHLNLGRGPRSGSGMYAQAHYRMIEHQPADEQVRENPAWQAWCRAYVKAAKAAKPSA